MSMNPEQGSVDTDPKDAAAAPGETPAERPAWTRPEITSFKPVSDAQGISYRRGDGLTNSST